MKTIEQLLERQKELSDQLEVVRNEIHDYKDGFDYRVCVHSYGSHTKYVFNNVHAALMHCSEYYRDNGYAHLYSNNPKLRISIGSGDVFYIENISMVDAWSHPKEAVLVLTEENMRNESELNALENQSNEE
jgi:hypothetical protein